MSDPVKVLSPEEMQTALLIMKQEILVLVQRSNEIVTVLNAVVEYQKECERIFQGLNTIIQQTKTDDVRPVPGQYL